MQVWCQWLQPVSGFSAKSDFHTGERPVFVGERYLMLFNNGATRHITSLKNENPSIFSLVCLSAFSCPSLFLFKGTSKGCAGENLLTTGLISLTTGCFIAGAMAGRAR